MKASAKSTPAIAVDRDFLFSHPAHFIALGFGSGLPKFAPGTWGTLAALPLFYLLQLALPNPIIVALCVPMFALGVWVSEITGQHLGVSDFGGIVIDEIVAMWLVLCFAPLTPLAWLLAFALFRLFDIIKPWPIRWLDAKVKGGLGVMVDDLLSAVFAIIPLLIMAPYLR